MVDWSKYEPEFTEDEFRCNCGQCGGKADMDSAFMDKLHALRIEYGKAITINPGGGFRCRLHPDEASKDKPGSHAQGKAGDLRTLSGLAKFEIKRLAHKHGFVGIGNGKTFTHLDVGHDHATRPADWTY